MLAATYEEAPRQPTRSWPEHFNTRQLFSRKSENLPYIKWLRDNFERGDEGSDEEDDEDEDDDEAEEGEDDDNEHNGDTSVCLSRVYSPYLIVSGVLLHLSSPPLNISRFAPQ